MIQRIQSVYLLLAALTLALLFMLPLYTVDLVVDGNTKLFKIMVTGTYEKGITDVAYTLIRVNRPQFFITSIMILGLLVCIFLYRDRKRQLRVVRLWIILEFALMIFLLSMAKHEMNILGKSSAKYGYGAFLPSLSVVFTALASRAIRKDEALVRAADRLR